MVASAGSPAAGTTSSGPRVAGRTGRELSTLAFGCGDNAELMVQADTARQVAVVGRALDGGIDLFDTAAKYGGGESERALGRVLARLGSPEVTIASKVSVDPLPRSGGALADIARSCEESLGRLSRDHIDLYQVHNRFVSAPGRQARPSGGLPGISMGELTDPGGIGDALVALRQRGDVRALGFTAYGGDPETIREVIDLGLFDSMNVSYHLLNPTSVYETQGPWPALDYAGVAAHAAQAGLDVLGIRSLAGGHLTGEAGRSRRGPSPDVADTTASRAALERWIAERGGSSTALALRFALMTPSIASVVCGFSRTEHVDAALAVRDTDLLGEGGVQAWARRLYEAVRGDDG